jgi:DNA-binding NtrC family response regulator
MKILLIDTDPEWIKFVKRIFRNVVVNDPTARADVALVSDMQLCAPSCRFLVVTNAPTPRGEIEAYRMGASDYIIKTFDEKELRAAIK